MDADVYELAETSPVAACLLVAARRGCALRLAHSKASILTECAQSEAVVSDENNCEDTDIRADGEEISP